MRWNRRMRFLCTLCNMVSRKFYLHLYICVSLNITKWCKVYTKTDSWFQRSHEEFGQLHKSSGKSKKLKLDGLLSSEKYIPSAIHYLQRISNIAVNYLYENSLNSLCYFQNHKPFFTTKLLCIFLLKYYILHTFYESSPSKRKFPDFPLLALKFTKIFLESLDHFLVSRG